MRSLVKYLQLLVLVYVMCVSYQLEIGQALHIFWVYFGRVIALAAELVSMPLNQHFHDLSWREAGIVICSPVENELIIWTLYNMPGTPIAGGSSHTPFDEEPSFTGQDLKMYNKPVPCGSSYHSLITHNIEQQQSTNYALTTGSDTRTKCSQSKAWNEEAG